MGIKLVNKVPRIVTGVYSKLPIVSLNSVSQKFVLGWKHYIPNHISPVVKVCIEDLDT